MAWPQATDYSAAIQSPASSFRDAELRSGEAASDAMLGLPLTYAGNFACVFKLACPSGNAWAVKCFTRPVTDLQERYRAISDHLDRNRRKFAVEFVYLHEGVRANASWYPALKMRWVEGFTLNEFLRDRAGQPAVVDQLARLWLKLCGELREAGMAHGDLQHGNVLLVPGSTATMLGLRLIDYDGMWVPALDGRPPGEVGHPNYQHPQRLANGGYSAEIDRFSHLVIYTAFRALAVGGQPLWDRHDNGENLLFRAADLRAPGKSKLFADLAGLPGDDLRALVGHLIDACLRPLDEVPLLIALVDEGAVMPLSAAQAARLTEVLPNVAWPRPVFVAPIRTSVAAALPRTQVVMDALAVEEELAATPRHPPMRSSAAQPPPPPPRRRPLPWPALPTWARLGMPARAWPVLYWPVTLGVLLSLPGLLLVLWLVLGAALSSRRRAGPSGR